MCSLSGEVMYEDNKNNLILNFNTCKKCACEKPVIVLRKTDPYCKECFLYATVHKFRQSFGKYRLVKPNERVLIIYRVGHASTALLHFIHSGLELNTHKKLRFEPVILYVDDQNLTIEHRFELCKKIRQELSNYNFHGYYTSLSNFIKDFNSVPKYFELNENFNIDNIEDNFNLLKINDDTKKVALRQLIIRLTKELKCRVAFIDDISVEVAIQMISNISFGRGSHLSLDVGVRDDRDTDVTIFQPLRYFDMKELVFYNVYNNLEPLSIIQQNQKENMKSSVNKVVTKFVNGLQENYPSTIKTVVRTGDKLTCEKNGNVCKICRAPVEVQSELSACEAQQFSHWISTTTREECEENEENSFRVKFNNDICYSCRKILL